MDKKWIDEKIKEQEDRRKEICDRIMKAVEEADNINREDKEMIKDKIKKKSYMFIRYAIEKSILFYHVLNGEKGITEEALEKEYQPFYSLGLEEMSSWDPYDSERIKNLQDSEPKFYSGDIIITDPCYLMRTHDDWHKCECGDFMENLGFENFMVRDTICGDWSCTTFDSDTKEKIGSFCADAGEVGVFLLDEVLKYNPDFNYHIEKIWTTTLIKDFEGTVQFTVTEESYEYNGKREVEYVVRVIGHGKNKATGEPINFITIQTGF